MVLQGVTCCYMVTCYRVLDGVTGYYMYMVLHGVTECYMVLHGVTECNGMLHCVTKEISPFCLVVGCAQFLSKGPKQPYLSAF